MKRIAALACASILTSAFALVIVGQPSLAAGKGKGGGGSGPVFVPEILYTYGKELRLTNADGSIAKLVYRPRRNGPLMRPILGPRTANGGLIALRTENDGTLFRWFYSSSGEVQVQQLGALPHNGNRIEHMAFSPDGSKIAYIVDYSRVYIADVSNPVSPTLHKNFPLSGVFVDGITWINSGGSIVLLGCDGTYPAAPTTCGHFGLYSLNPESGAVLRVTPPNTSQDHIISGLRSARTSDGILSSGGNWIPDYEPWDFVYYAAPGFATPVEYAPTGFQAVFSCDDTKIAYRDAANATWIYTVNASSVSFSNDYTISIEDWMPGCPTT